MKCSHKIFCYGAGGHGRVVADVIVSMRDTEFIGFVDDQAKEGMIGRHPFLGTTECLKSLATQECEAIVAIGNNRVRVEKAEQLSRLGFRLAKAVHVHAVVAPDAQVGFGSVVMGGVVINSGAKIGANVIINTGATIDHDCSIGDGTHVSPGANLAGGVIVGAGVHVGIGAVIVPGIVIGAGAIVGAGAVVIRNVEAGATMVGNPAREIEVRQGHGLRG